MAYRTGSNVPSEPFPETISLLFEVEHGFELVFKSEIQSLGGEVADDVCTITAPQSEDSYRVETSFRTNLNDNWNTRLLV